MTGVGSLRYALVRLSGVCGMVAMGLGALGGHGLEAHLESVDRVEDWRTATRYLAIHAVACLVVGLAGGRVRGLSGWLFGLGALLFALSLYVICLTGVTTWGIGTPFGGLAMLFGWVMLLWKPNEQSEA